jgi:hypothetical protein
LAQFALFIEDQYGPLFRQHQDDLAEARRKAQELADREGVRVFIFSFREARRLDTFEPRPLANRGGSRRSPIRSPQEPHEMMPLRTA